MTESLSRGITTNQTGPHDNVDKVVSRHLRSASQKPFSQHTLEAFAEAQAWLGDWQGPIILDSCCGVGESTQWIAHNNPQAKVIGVDKSALRVGKHSHYQQEGTNNNNHILIQGDLNDFWRLAHQAQWQLSQHYLLYPNPYPKSAHFQRRWHGSSAFADILRLKGELIVRSNWRIYIEEFCLALAVAGIKSEVVEYTAEEPMTPFERKYWLSGQSSWQVRATL